MCVCVWGAYLEESGGLGARSGAPDACVEPWALGRLSGSDPSSRILLEAEQPGRAWAGGGGGRGQGGVGPLSTALVLVGGRGGCGASQAACSHSR